MGEEMAVSAGALPRYVWPAHQTVGLWSSTGASARAGDVEFGTRLAVLGRVDDYYLVTLPDGSSGHVLVDAVSAPSPPEPREEPEPAAGAAVDAKPSLQFNPQPGAPDHRLARFEALSAATAGAELTFTRASFGHRLGGFVVDGVINWFGSLFLTVLLYRAFLAGKTGSDFATAQLQVTLFVVLVGFVYKWIADSMGGTLGKIIVGIRVVDDATGQPPGLGAGLVRIIVSILSGIPLLLGYL